MRKPRDYDTELKALTDKARHLKNRKQSQLGELVINCGADALGVEELAGALLMITATTDSAAREAWRKRGAAFFCGQPKEPGRSTGDKSGSAAPDNDGTQSSSAEPGAA